MKINYSQLKEIYAIGVIVAVPAAGFTAFCSRPYLSYSEESLTSPVKKGISVIGYSTIGMLVGVAYPITFPIAAFLTVIEIKEDDKARLAKKKLCYEQ
jgi:hypothetical protein